MTSRIAYVTSGMGGVGTAICQALARSGHTVVAGCAPDSPRRAAWLAAQKALGFHFIASEGDVTDWASTTRAFGAVQRELGPIDVLVHNAGRSCERHFRDMAPSDWQAGCWARKQMQASTRMTMAQPSNPRHCCPPSSRICHRFGFHPKLRAVPSFTSC